MQRVRGILLISLVLATVTVSGPLSVASAAVQHGSVVESVDRGMKSEIGVFSGEPDVGQTSGSVPDATYSSVTSPGEDLIQWFHWTWLIWKARFSETVF